MMEKRFWEGFTFKGNIYVAMLLRLALAMFLFTLCRIGFYLFNTNYFPGLTASEFIRIFYGGLRFDLIQLDGEDVYWLEGRASEGGRNVIVRRSPSRRTSVRIAGFHSGAGIVCMGRSRSTVVASNRTTAVRRCSITSTAMLRPTATRRSS
jgi:hypothetical protein